MCEPDETVREAFERDPLRKAAQFNDYLFVYLPNTGTTPNEKLGCIEALTEMLTGRYKYGKSNLFLKVNDTLIIQNDIVSSGLKSVFRSIRLNNEKINSLEQAVDSINYLADFNEKALEYKPDEKKELDLATYYVEADKEDESQTDSSDIKPLKTYFGPPEAHNYTLTGIVRDQATGEALPFTNIQIKGTTLGVSSNADGYFTLLKVPSDTNTLVVQYVGYLTTEIFLTPQTPKKNFNIDIKPYSQTLKEVRITAYKDDVVFVKRNEVSTIKLTPVKMSQLPSIGEKDVMRSFQLMPGISASNESSSGLYVRGGTPDQNLVLYDGFTVYHVDHLYGFFSAFNSNALKDIQLYKGGFESRFGGRISSVTEITSKEGNQKKVNFGADISLLSTNVFAEIPVGSKFSSFIAFRIVPGSYVQYDIQEI